MVSANQKEIYCVTEVLFFVFLIGLPCPEIHVCGESSAVNLVERLVSSCNDELEVRLAWEIFSSLDTDSHNTSVEHVLCQSQY